MSRRAVSEQEVKANLKGLVISSAKGLTVVQLSRDYRESIGQEIPYRALGFSSLLDFLHSIPDTLKLHGSGTTALVVPVADEKLIHLEEMVQAQRKDTRKTRHSLRSSRSRPLRRPCAILNISKTSENGNTGASNSSNFKTHSYRDNVRPFSKKLPDCYDEDSSDCDTEIDYQPPPPTKIVNTNPVKQSIKHTNTVMNDSISSISSRSHASSLRNRLIALIEDYPDGIWCSELPTAYKNKFNHNLDITSKGYLSVIHFCSAYKDIFRFEQPSNGDWKVYDSRKKSPPKEYSEYKCFGMQGDTNLGSKSSMSALPDELEEFLEPDHEDRPPDDVVKFGEKLITQWLEIPDDYITVRVTEVYDPSKFWIQLYSEDCSEALDNLMNTMQNVYVTLDKSYDVPVSQVRVGLYVAALIYNEWHRGQVVKIDDETYCRVNFFDYGTLSKIQLNALKYLHRDFGTLPRQAIRARLANIKPRPPNLSWSLKASQYFLDLVTNKILVADIINSDRIKNRTLELILTDTSDVTKDVHINDMIKKRYLAAIVKDPTQMIVPSYGPIKESSYFLYPLHEHIEEAKCPTYDEIVLMCSNGIDRELITKTFIISLNNEQSNLPFDYIRNDFNDTDTGFHDDTTSQFTFDDTATDFTFNDAATEYSLYTQSGFKSPSTDLNATLDSPIDLSTKSSKSIPSLDKSWMETYDNEDNASIQPPSPVVPLIKEQPIFKPTEVLKSEPLPMVMQEFTPEVSNSGNVVKEQTTYITATETIMQPSINVTIAAPPGFGNMSGSPSFSNTQMMVPQFQNPDPFSLLLASNFICRNAMAMLPPANNFYQPYPPTYMPPQFMPLTGYPIPPYPGLRPPSPKRSSKEHKEQKVNKHLEELNKQLNVLTMKVEQIGSIRKEKEGNVPDQNIQMEEQIKKLETDCKAKEEISKQSTKKIEVVVPELPKKTKQNAKAITSSSSKQNKQVKSCNKSTETIHPTDPKKINKSSNKEIEEPIKEKAVSKEVQTCLLAETDCQPDQKPPKINPSGQKQKEPVIVPTPKITKVSKKEKKKSNKLVNEITEKVCKNNTKPEVETVNETNVNMVPDTKTKDNLNESELVISPEKSFNDKGGKVFTTELGSGKVHVVKIEDELYFSMLEFLQTYTKFTDVDKVKTMLCSESLEFPFIDLDLTEYNTVYETLIRDNVPGSSVIDKKILLLKFEEVPFVLEKLFASNKTLVKDMFKFTMEQAKSS